MLRNLVLSSRHGFCSAASLKLALFWCLLPAARRLVHGAIHGATSAFTIRTDFTADHLPMKQGHLTEAAILSSVFQSFPRGKPSGLNPSLLLPHDLHDFQKVALVSNVRVPTNLPSPRSPRPTPIFYRVLIPRRDSLLCSPPSPRTLTELHF